MVFFTKENHLSLFFTISALKGLVHSFSPHICTKNSRVSQVLLYPERILPSLLPSMFHWCLLPVDFQGQSPFFCKWGTPAQNPWSVRRSIVCVVTVVIVRFACTLSLKLVAGILSPSHVLPSGSFFFKKNAVKWGMSSSFGPHVACAGSSMGLWIWCSVCALISAARNWLGRLQKKTLTLLAVSHLLLSGLGESGCVFVQQYLGKD